MEDNAYKEILPNLREYARQAREDYYKKIKERMMIYYTSLIVGTF